MGYDLLPVWALYKKQFAKKEPLETFEWLSPSDRDDYEQARDALDATPGSREYLKDYVCPKNSIPFSDPMGKHLIVSFGLNSLLSAQRLAWNYRFALNDWDSFVFSEKDTQGRKVYDHAQLNYDDIHDYDFARSDIGKLRFSHYDYSFKAERRYNDAIEKIRRDYALTFSKQVTAHMLDELLQEIREENTARVKKDAEDEFNFKISVLKHHYEFPNRWYDDSKGSKLFGSPENITREMYDIMEKIHPGYRLHIANIKFGHS